MNSDFLTAFSRATGLPRIDADAQWAAFSAQLSDSEREQIESRGASAGAELGAEFNEFVGSTRN